jgi:hypothetical protein
VFQGVWVRLNLKIETAGALIMKLSLVIKLLGYVLLISGIGAIAIGYIGIVMKDGFGALMDILSPFNVWNYISVIVTLAPGILLLMWSNRIDRKRNSAR